MFDISIARPLLSIALLSAAAARPPSSLRRSTARALQAPRILNALDLSREAVALAVSGETTLQFREITDVPLPDVWGHSRRGLAANMDDWRSDRPEGYRDRRRAILGVPLVL